MIQEVQYEGINDICFACERIDHRKEGCPTIIKKLKSSPDSPNSNEQQQNLNASMIMSQGSDQRDVGESGMAGMEYGDWMVVKRKNRPYRNQGNSRKPNTSIGVTGRNGEVANWHT